MSVADLAGERPVLGVDTAVVVDDDVLGKPQDAAEAEAMIERLAGRTHEVVGGIALARDGAILAETVDVTDVTFRALDDAWIEWYLDTGEWRDRAGGYAIQGRGAALVEAIEGDFWNVVGLPVAALMRLAPELVVGGDQSDQRGATPRSASRSRSSSSAV